MKQNRILYLIFLCVLFALSGCGIKPDRLSPPTSQEDVDDYPHTYPDPAALDK